VRTHGRLELTQTPHPQRYVGRPRGGVEGTAGGGLVSVKLSGKGELKSAQFDDSLLKPDQKPILQDLIVAAHADARRKLEALLAERMQSLTGGLSLPPGLKLF